MKRNDPYTFFNRFKSNSKGYCLICNNYGKLTLDHIFPACCGNKDIVIFDCLHRNLSIAAPKGFTFRTICEICNNTILAPLDKKLAKICNTFCSYLSSNFRLNNKVQFEGDIEDIKKCIVGHVLAGFELPQETSKSNTEKKGFLREIYFDYLTDKKPLPSNYKIHYWLHKYETFLFSPGFGINADYRYKNAFFTCSLLKFKPLGFLIVDYNNSICNLDLPFLHSDNSDNFTLHFRDELFMPDDFPVRPQSNGMIFMSNANLFYGKKNIS